MGKDNEYTLVIPFGYTREEYLGLDSDDKKSKREIIGEVFLTILMISFELLMLTIKSPLFFMEEYPKNLEKVRREEAEKRATDKK